MKRFIALVLASVASLQAAPATVSSAGGSEMVMTPVTHSAVMETEAFSFIPALVQPVTVFTDVRPTASTKVVVCGLTSQKFAAADAQVRWKAVNAHRAPASVWYICAAASSPPTTSFPPAKPEAGLVGSKTPLAWHAPADDDPTVIETGYSDVS